MSLASLTGYTIGELARICGDLKISILNVVIDACQAGHAQTDLREAIERPARVAESALSINVTAASLSGQPALAGDPLSPFTSILIDYVDGNCASRSSRPFLSLSDLSPLLAEDGRLQKQNVVHACLNALGHAPFCENPLHSQSENQPHNRILSPLSSLGSAAFSAKEALNRIYSDLDKHFDHRELFQTLNPITTSPGANPPELAQLLDHYAEWFLSKAKGAADWSLPMKVVAALATSSLAEALGNNAFQNELLLILSKGLEGDRAFFNERFEEWLETTQARDHDAGIDDFFFLPVRISAIYARLGLIYLAQAADVLPPEHESKVSQIPGLLMEAFPNAHLVLIESQAIQMTNFYVGCALSNQPRLAEEAYGAYFLDHCLTRGRHLRDGAKGPQVLAYLRERARDESNIQCDALAVPNTTIPTFMMCAPLLGLESVCDESLAVWNGLTTNLFLPASCASFAEPRICHGHNEVLDIGRDVYSCEDFRRCVEREPLHEVSKCFAMTELLLVLTGVHLYPNRIP